MIEEQKRVSARWFWAVWLVTVILLVGATAAAEQLGPVIHPALDEVGPSPDARPARAFPRRAAPKKKTSLAPGEAKIDLNTASVEVLVTLPGIGQKRAEQIVALRTKRPFRRVTELRRVRGIGKKTMRRLLPLVTVSKPAPRAKAKAKVKAKGKAKAKRKPRGRVRMVVPG